MSMIWSEANESRFQELSKIYDRKKHPRDRGYAEFMTLKLKKERIEFVNAQPD